MRLLLVSLPLFLACGDGAPAFPDAAVPDAAPTTSIGELVESGWSSYATNSTTLRVMTADFSTSQVDAWLVVDAAPVAFGWSLHVDVSQTELLAWFNDDDWIGGVGYEAVFPVNLDNDCAGVRPGKATPLGSAQVSYVKWSSARAAVRNCALAGSISLSGPPTMNHPANKLVIELNVQFDDGTVLEGASLAAFKAR